MTSANAAAPVSGAPGAAMLLVCKVGAFACGFPLSAVSEVMRPLPIEPVASAPEFVAGLAIIRGAAVPVVDLGRMLTGETAHEKKRLVVLKAEPRKVALLVTAVLGARAIDARTIGPLPPLLHGERARFIDAIGSLDRELLLVLQSARILPDSAWTALEGGGSA